MDINARINWVPGMEVTAQTFIEVAGHWDFKQRIALRAALGSNRMGLLPGAPYSCRGVFVKNQFEAENFQCTALLPSGRIISADEDVVVPIPMLFGDTYYLTVGFGEGFTEFEKEGVPFARPHYVYGIHTRDEVEADDVFPLVRFRVHEGAFSIDPDFMPPCLLLKADARFQDYVASYIERLQALSVHKSLADGEGKRAILHYIFLLKGYNMDNSMQDFVLMTQEVAQAIDYYIVAPNLEQPIEIPAPSQVDVQMWLKWLDDYLAGAAIILDGVVLDDTTIDYETLLAQAKKELYERLHPELIEKLLADMKEELRAEIDQQTERITTYINETLKTEMLQQLSAVVDDRTNKMNDMITQRIDKLSADLRDELYEKLYFELFDHLFNALYVPDPGEKEYIPII